MNARTLFVCVLLSVTGRSAAPAANGIRFSRAYCANPVCVPSRIGMMTGRLPGLFGARENGSGMRVADVPPSVRQACLGPALKAAGYELAYGGKVHLPGPLQPAALGFKVITGDQRDGLAEACASFIRADHDRPYCLIASFINPHDICYLAIHGGPDSVMRLRAGNDRAVRVLRAARERPGEEHRRHPLDRSRRHGWSPPDGAQDGALRGGGSYPADRHAQGHGAGGDPRGRSLRPLIEGKTPADWRRTLGVESQMGRMVVGERYKYILYDEGASREQLMDLGEDPCETRNFARRESHAEILSRMRAAYREWFPDPPREMEGAR